MRLELHCHSTCSDGSVAPDEVARMAAKWGVALFCLTDHDTVAGYEATRDALAEAPVRVLRGLELSCRAYDRTVHVLVYGVREGPGMDALAKRLEEIAAQRRIRLRRICDRLDELGIHLDADAIVSRSHGRTAGRPDVARALVEAGVCTSPREAFTRFLRDGGPADVPVDRLSVPEGLALGRDAGAKMSLAHPHQLGSWDLVHDLFTRMRGEGLEGIEAFYGRYGRAESDGWLRLANELDLVATGGSDFHGDLDPRVSRPGIVLAEDRAEALCRWLELDE